MRDFEDNITNILKSMSPIKLKFSRQNRELDRRFKNMCLEKLISTLDYRPKIVDEFAPNPEYLKNKNQYEINFQNSDEYIKELSNLNNLPLVQQNRNCIKNGMFNPDFKTSQNKSQKDQIKFLALEKERRLQEKLKLCKERLRKYRESNVNTSSLDPLKYNPNYDSIRKKVPCAYIRTPTEKILPKYYKPKETIKEDSKNSIEKENNDETKNKEENLNTIKEEEKEIKNEEGNNEDNNNNIRNDEKSKTLRRKKIEKTKIQNELSNKSINYSFSENNNKSTKEEENILHYQQIYNSSKSPKFKKIKNIKNLKLKNWRCSSLDNIYNKNYIIFKKMLGRNELFEKKQEFLRLYFPNYETTLPRIPSFIFKYKKDPQNYKKYVTGKIIRNYFYDPDNYYVMDYKKNIYKILQ